MPTPIANPSIALLLARSPRQKATGRSTFHSKLRGFARKPRPAFAEKSMPDNAGMTINPHDAQLIDLLDRIARHDELALKALYDTCASKLYGLALRVVPQRELAEDVLQDSFLTVWQIGRAHV